MKYLGLILKKLRNLNSVILASAGSSPVNTSRLGISCDSLSHVSLAPANLERLELSQRFCILPSIRKWFKTLDKLCILKIAVMASSNSDIDILKGFPPSPLSRCISRQRLWRGLSLANRIFSSQVLQVELW